MTLSDVSRCPECRLLSVIARVPAPLSVSPLWVLAQPARAGCHAAQAAPVTRHVTSFVTRATPDIGQHGWAVRAAWSTEAALLISVIVRIPGPGHWSHQAHLTHPGHHHLMISACSSTSLLSPPSLQPLFPNLPDLSWSQVSVTLRLGTVTRLAPELHNVSS